MWYSERDRRSTLCRFRDEVFGVCAFDTGALSTTLGRRASISFGGAHATEHLVEIGPFDRVALLKAA